jgi:hypothetical protein
MVEMMSIFSEVVIKKSLWLCLLNDEKVFTGFD